jgi:hypothetical protein
MQQTIETQSGKNGVSNDNPYYIPAPSPREGQPQSQSGTGLQSGSVESKKKQPSHDGVCKRRFPPQSMHLSELSYAINEYAKITGPDLLVVVNSMTSRPV